MKKYIFITGATGMLANHLYREVKEILSNSDSS